MTKKEFTELEPFLKTLNKNELKTIWYIEARKKGNPCITKEQKKEALKTPLIDIGKIVLHNWNHKDGNNYY